MAFLSELLSRSVTDIDGKPVGVLTDLVAKFRGDMAHPVVEAIVVRGKDEPIRIPFSEILALFTPAISLSCREEDIHPYQLVEHDVLLAQDILDKQIIDTEGARVVRVNDLELLRVNGMIVVSNVDIGSMGLLRRLGLAKSTNKIASKLKKKFPQHFISWDDMELLRHDQGMRLKVPVSKINELHPADVAEIITDLNRLESRDFIQSLDVEHLADTLEEVEPDFQASLVEGMTDEKVADVLDEMNPDEAADLLAEFPKERSEDLLALMEKDEAADVRMLLAYPEDSAGGLMTTEYFAVNLNLTVEQAIQALRQSAHEAETVFYVYVIDEENHLVGVFSLPKLIFASPQTPIASFMKTRIISVHPLDSQDDVAQMIAKYNLLAVPVVDDDNCLLGIVTSDDALDKMIPTAWKKRLPRLYR